LAGGERKYREAAELRCRELEGDCERLRRERSEEEGLRHRTEAKLGEVLAELAVQAREAAAVKEASEKAITKAEASQARFKQRVEEEARAHLAAAQRAHEEERRRFTEEAAHVRREVQRSAEKLQREGTGEAAARRQAEAALEACPSGDSILV
jgi:hypothetical protein